MTTRNEPTVRRDLFVARLVEGRHVEDQRNQQ